MIKVGFKFVFILALLSYRTCVFSATQNIEKCEDLICVRKNIDTLNKQIVELLSIRMEYVYQAGYIKLNNKVHSAKDQKRVEVVFAQVDKLAKEYNLPKDYVRKIFTIIVNDSTKFEQEKMNVMKK